MGSGGAADPTSAARRAPARCQRARSSQRHLLCALDGLPVEGVAEGPAAEEHGALLLHAVGLGPHARAHPPRTLRRSARAGRARSQPDGGDHRQPECQGVSKRGSALDPQGFDAGKKVTGRKRHILVDAGYQGPKMTKVVADTGCWTLQIVKRSDAHRFVVLPKRWIVERTFAWISRNRRLARDFERYARTVAAFVRLAMIRVMLKRLTRPSLCS